MKFEDTSGYNDIINLPHRESDKHPRMPRRDRAAQFSPFAALTGHDAAIRETARVTEERIILEEDAKTELNERLMTLIELGERAPVATIEYFKPDGRKSGGAYLYVSGRIKEVDEISRTVIMYTDEVIPIDDIYGIESAVFSKL